MTVVDAKLIEILKQQIEVEERTLAHLTDAENSVTEPAVRLILMELRLDTWKHKELLKGMIEIISTTPCDTWSAKVERYVERVKLERILEAVIEEEGNMIELLEKALAEVNDPLAKTLFSRLRDDEQRHDKGLREVVKMIKTAPLQSRKGRTGADIVCED